MDRVARRGPRQSASRACLHHWRWPSRCAFFYSETTSGMRREDSGVCKVAGEGSANSQSQGVQSAIGTSQLRPES